MRQISHRRLVLRLIGAVVVAFAASMVLTWALHDRMTEKEAGKLIDCAFEDIEGAIREKVDSRLIRQAMVVRDRLPELRALPLWNDPDASSRRLRELANELQVDEICVADSNGILTHSARREEVGALDFVHAKGQASEFAALLGETTELAQPLLPNSLRGDMVKYVGVWIPEGGFVQVGCRDAGVRRLSRTAVTGLTHDRHVSGKDGYIVITTASGTIISHPDPDCESGLWREPGDDCYWQKRVLEGYPVYVVIPKRTAIVERRVLVGTSAFLNAMALVFAAFLVGIVIAGYVRGQMLIQRAKEMRVASEIQESAIPRVFPPFPGERRVDIYGNMKPAKDVGGDFYDFYFSGPRKITFLIADVSDKGVPAALFMMRAKTIIKGIAQAGKPIADVATETNEALCEGNGANMFVTAWMGEIDLDTGVVSFVNAGHNPPMVVKDGGAEYLTTPPGLVLGAMSGVKYSSQAVALAPGEALYLYTDGITEQSDSRGVLFGEDRLRQIVSDPKLFGRPQKLVDAVLAGVSAHAGAEEQSDDRTQLIIRYCGT